MGEFYNNASSDNGQPKGPASDNRKRWDELAAQADLMLARYPAEVRDQVVDLLRVLVAKPGHAETKFDNDFQK
jgi:hypothetical protein